MPDSIQNTIAPHPDSPILERPDSLAADTLGIDSLRLVGPPAYVEACDSDSVAGYGFDDIVARAMLLQPKEVVEERAPEWTYGREGTPRHVSIGDNSGVLAIIASVFIMLMLCYRRSRRYLAVLWQELWADKWRKNLFDEPTTNETSAMILMAAQWSMCVGLLLYSGLSVFHNVQLPPENAFPDMVKLMGLAAGYYIFQLCAYWTLGYTYSDTEGRLLYVHSFTSTQSLIGLVLVIPALGAIFYPSSAGVMLIIGAICYGLARILFIFKGFRIFYTNFGSLLYFILYLCTLEIIPLIFVCRIAELLVFSL